MCFVLKIKKYINTYYSFVILKLFFYLLINHSRTIIESSCCLSLCYRHAAGYFAFLVFFKSLFSLFFSDVFFLLVFILSMVRISIQGKS